MINVNERRKDVVKWHFPDDEENPTIFHLKWLSGPEQSYLRMMKAEAGEKWSLDQWRKETMVNSVVKIENWQDENGKPTTLTKPKEIGEALEYLTENEIYLLMAAIRRDGEGYNLGKVEKN